MPHPNPLLVAEDDPTFRALVVELLRGEGYLVVEAADGVELLELARRHDPCLVLTDQHMPRLDGTEALGRLRAEGRRCPAVLVTSFADADLREAARALDCRVLDKPVDVSLLIDTVRELTR